MAVLGLVGVAAAVTRPAAELVDALPSLVGGLVIAGALLVLLRPLQPAPSDRKWLRVQPTHRKPLSVHADRASATAVAGSDDRRTGHPGPDDRAAPPDEGAGVAVDRRAFLGAAALVAVGAAATGGVAVLLGRSATSTAYASRCGSPRPPSPLRRSRPVSSPGS